MENGRQQTNTAPHKTTRTIIPGTDGEYFWLAEELQNGDLLLLLPKTPLPKMRKEMAGNVGVLLGKPDQRTVGLSTPVATV
ncbi:MAG: hypothetical protein V1926_03470 [Candidatus Peregrinibacteria bacterium]